MKNRRGEWGGCTHVSDHCFLFRLAICLTPTEKKLPLNLIKERKMIVAILIKEINEELPLVNSNLTAKAPIFLVRHNQACIYAQQEYAKQFIGITVRTNKATHLFFVSTDATLDMRRISRLPVIGITRPRCIVTAVTRVEYSTARKLHEATPLIMLALPSRALLDRRPFSPKPPFIPVFIFYLVSPFSFLSFPYFSI